MTHSQPPTILCIATFFKGNEFIRECKQQGARVVLLTREKLANANWAFDSLDDLRALPGKVTEQSYLEAALKVMRHQRVTRVVALEEYDVVTAAFIREQTCIQGPETTTARRFQDKLAMRDRARNTDIPQPHFVSLVNHDAVANFSQRIAPPWMLKPRFGASAMGIRKLNNQEDVWRAIAELDKREGFQESSVFHLLEHYIPGDVYHVNSLVVDGKVIFASVEHYCAPPFDISQHGGVNISHTVRRDSPEEQRLLEVNRRVLERFGIERGVTHAEFVHSSTSNEFYFLEVAARVGGAHTAETIEAASGINLWREWARIELATSERPYSLPPVNHDYGGIVVSLARQEHPSTEAYKDPEIVYRVNKPWHVGLVVRSPSYDRVMELLARYQQSFAEHFAAVAPPEEKPQQYL
jgi:biotin carboxylase